MKLYEICQQTNNYTKKVQFFLLIDGVYHTTISEKALNKIKERKINFKDSDAIKQFAKYNNF